MKRPGEYQEKETSTGNATDRTIFYALQTIDQYGTTYNDPNAEWEVTHLIAGSTLAGTIKLTKVDVLGVSTDLTDAISVPAGGGIDLELKRLAGAEMDVAFTTTGGGDWIVLLTAISRRYTIARPAMTEVP